MPTSVEGARIACLDFNLNKFRMKMGVQVLVDDPKNLEKIRQRELDILKERIQMILDAGANVILTTGGIDDVANKYLVENQVLGLRRVSKSDIRKIAKCSGATLMTTLSNMDGNETFESSFLGSAKRVYEQAVGDNDFIFFEGMKKANACSIILRGPNELMLDEVERSLHDSLCVLKRTLECGYVVAGGGACEIAVQIYLEDFAKTLASKEQIAIAEFCEALSIIPKTLATNAA